MTNGEWLDYLAQNAPDELSAWFDAEHVETEERALDGDTAPENEDSREQLEVDIRKYANPEGNTGTLGACWERKMLEFIDRQAAITSHQWESYHNGMMREWMAKTVELQEQVDELTAERDKLQEQLRIGWECECRLQAERDKFKEANDYHALQYELASEDCDRLQAQVDELQAITDERWNKYIAEHLRADTLADDLLTANRQREQYREKLSNVMDAVHEAYRAGS